MKKWLRRILIAALLVGLILVCLYEAATHVGRGWLRGEAFFDGRPTSYWRYQVDQWMARHNSPKAAEQALNEIRLQSLGGMEVPWSDVQPDCRIFLDEDGRGWAFLEFVRPAPTFWERLRSTFVADAEGYEVPPKVLSGLAGAESVLRELDAEAKYRPFTERARRNAEIIQQDVEFLPSGRATFR